MNKKERELEEMKCGGATLLSTMSFAAAIFTFPVCPPIAGLAALNGVLWGMTGFQKHKKLQPSNQKTKEDSMDEYLKSLTSASLPSLPSLPLRPAIDFTDRSENPITPLSISRPKIAQSVLCRQFLEETHETAIAVAVREYAKEMRGAKISTLRLKLGPLSLATTKIKPY